VRPQLPAAPRRDRDEQRLSRDLCYSRKALDTALAAAAKHGVMAYGEIVEGDPVTQILEFATSRNAPVLVVGQRRQAAEKSVSRQVIGLSPSPVVVAADANDAGD
jgi:nucleotide-binding universal stress UspA family protein